MLLWLLDDKRQSISIGETLVLYSTTQILRHALSGVLLNQISNKILINFLVAFFFFKIYIFNSIPIPELKESRASVTAIKKQAESTNAEYDRLAEENQKLQVRHNLNFLATQTEGSSLLCCIFSLQNRLQELETGRETQKDK